MDKNKRFNKRQKRVRSIIAGNPSRIRLSVFRSGKHIYAQIIDDNKALTLFSASDLDEEVKEKRVIKRKESAFLVGEKIAEKALKKGIKGVVFDRGGYRYHGRVKELANGARKGGLIF